MQTAPEALRLLAHRLSGAGTSIEAAIDHLIGILGLPKTFERGESLVEQGARDGTVWLIASGWAARQKMLHDGRRQIITIMLPGELTEKGPEMPFGSPDAVVALSNVIAHPIHQNALLDLTQQAPALLYALFYEELTRHAITREWILLHSKRDAVERLAYFFYETFARLRAMGLIEGKRFELPLNQEDVADLLGVSHVHLNRTLQALRRQNHLIWEGHSVTIADEAGLARAAAFNPELIKIAEEFAARAKASQAADS